MQWHIETLPSALKVLHCRRDLRLEGNRYRLRCIAISNTSNARQYKRRWMAPWAPLQFLCIAPVQSSQLFSLIHSERFLISPCLNTNHHLVPSFRIDLGNRFRRMPQVAVRAASNEAVSLPGHYVIDISNRTVSIAVALALKSNWHRTQTHSMCRNEAVRAPYVAPGATLPLTLCKH